MKRYTFILIAAWMVAGSLFAVLNRTALGDSPPLQRSDAASPAWNRGLHTGDIGSAAAPAPNAGNPVLYVDMNPLVISTDVVEDVTIRVRTNGVPDRAELETPRGQKVPFTNRGNGLFSTVLSHTQALSGYDSDEDLNHNFLGHLKLYSDGTPLGAFNLFVNVADDRVPAVPVTSIAPDILVSPHLVNIHMPEADVMNLDTAAVTQRFYEVFEDEYDFIALVSVPARFANRFYMGLKNAEQGIGRPLFDNTAAFGSSGRLRGVLHFPLPNYFDLASTDAIHEIGHQWINYLQDIDALMGIAPHWPISTLAQGIMGYNTLTKGQGLSFPYEIEPLEGDNYKLKYVGRYREFNDMELYLMGLLPPTEVGQHMSFEDQNQPVCNGCVLHGPVQNFSVADVVAAYGPRVPAYPRAQRAFHMATIVVTTIRPLTRREMQYFDYFAARGQATEPLPYSIGLETGTTLPFRLATGNRGLLITTLTLPEIDFPLLWLPLIRRN